MCVLQHQNIIHRIKIAALLVINIRYTITYLVFIYPSTQHCVKDQHPEAVAIVVAETRGRIQFYSQYKINFTTIAALCDDLNITSFYIVNY